MSDDPQSIVDEIDEVLNRQSPKSIEPQPDRSSEIRPPHDAGADDYEAADVADVANVDEAVAADVLDHLRRGHSAARAAKETAATYAEAIDVRDAADDLGVLNLDAAPKPNTSDDYDEGDYYREWLETGSLPVDRRLDHESRLNDLVRQVASTTIEGREDVKRAAKLFEELSLLAEDCDQAVPVAERLYEAMAASARAALDEHGLDEGVRDERAPIGEYLRERAAKERGEPIEEDDFDRTLGDRNDDDEYVDMQDYLESEPSDDAREIARLYANALEDIHDDSVGKSAQIPKDAMDFQFGVPSGDASTATVNGENAVGETIALKIELDEEDRPYMAFAVPDNDSHIVMKLFPTRWMANLSLVIQHTFKAVQLDGYVYSEIGDLGQQGEDVARKYTRDLV